MSTWYVRPNTSHSGTRDGTTYATAWGGWSAITWGVGGVVGGDTLYVCGAHSSATTLTVGAHGGGAGTECAIRGDYAGDPGSIAITSAGQAFVPRSHTSFYDVDMSGASRTMLLSASLANAYFLGCTFNGGTNATFALTGADGTAHSDIRFELCEFNGGASAADGGGAAIDWYVSAASAVSTISRLSVRYCTFTDCNANGTGRGVIHLRSLNAVSTSSVVSDVVLEYNTFDGFSGFAFEGTEGHATHGLWKGIRAIGNVIKNGTEQTTSLGGAFSLTGFGASTTAGFGPNYFTRNTISNVIGGAGGFNLIYGSYLVNFNVAEDLSTTTTDACGVLFDHDCSGSSAVGNTFRRLTGKAGTLNSGAGIMVLDTTGVTASGNLVEDAQRGIYLGAAGSGQGCTIANNTFVNLTVHGITTGPDADLANCTVKNNVFIGDGYSVYDQTATAWSNENYNCFYGFASGTNNHTLGAQSITTDPLLDASYRPTAASPCRGAGTYIAGARHFGGKKLRSVPDIGAHRYMAARTIALNRAV